MTALSCFRVKICGVRKISDLQAAAAAGADTVGLNFYPPSVRYLPNDAHTAELATEARRLGLLTVGVFVNEAPTTMLRLAQALQLAAVQLHGDETLEQAGQILDQSLSVIRAVRLPTRALSSEEIDQAVSPWQAAGCGVLLDADAGGSFGGVGHRLDWRTIGRWAAAVRYPWMLAGGLTPESLGNAIKQARPYGVDVASGVEAPRGVKSEALIRRFCQIASEQLG